MKPRSVSFLVLLLLLFAFASAHAQLRQAMPDFRGIWNPVVGAGAVYSWEVKAIGKMEMEVTVVGTEMVGGKTGYWVEVFVKDPRYGEGITKILYVADKNRMEIKRLISKPPNEPPVEFPAEFLGTEEEPEPSDLRERSELVSTETLATPAGTFGCQHYRTKEQPAKVEEEEEMPEKGGAELAVPVVDYWFSDKVPPYGMVKTVSPDATMTLLRLVTGAKSRIQGTPKKLNPTELTPRPPL